jgi:four helix bundle protein
LKNSTHGNGAHSVVLTVYKTGARFPRDERFGIISQLRRLARKCTKDFVRYLEMAGGSPWGTRYFLRLSKDLHYLEEAEYGALRNMSDKVGRLLGGLQQALRRRLA